MSGRERGPEVGDPVQGWGSRSAALRQPHLVPHLVGDDGGPFLQFCVVERADPKSHLWAGRRFSCRPGTQGGSAPSFQATEALAQRPPPPRVGLPLLVKQLRPRNQALTSSSTAHDGAQGSTVVR